MATAQKTKEAGNYLLRPNPLVRKLNKVEETSSNAVTMRGIAGKCLYFMICVIIGIAIAVVLNVMHPIRIDIDKDLFDISPVMALGGLVSLVLFIVTPILAFLIRPTIPVTGTLYCIATGYFYTLLPLVIEEYAPLITEALVLTIGVIAVLAFLYSTGIVKVTQKFRSVVTTLFAVMILASLAELICYFIPATRHIAEYFVGNPLLGIGIAIAYIVIAAAFLLVDFDSAERAVENQLPKKYEWVAAFSLTFSVIWLFMKILDLLFTLKEGGK